MGGFKGLAPPSPPPVLSGGEGGDGGDLSVRLSCFSHLVRLGQVWAYRWKERKQRHGLGTGSLGHYTCPSLAAQRHFLQKSQPVLAAAFSMAELVFSLLLATCNEAWPLCVLLAGYWTDPFRDRVFCFVVGVLVFITSSLAPCSPGLALHVFKVVYCVIALPATLDHQHLQDLGASLSAWIGLPRRA